MEETIDNFYKQQQEWASGSSKTKITVQAQVFNLNAKKKSTGDNADAGEVQKMAVKVQRVDQTQKEAPAKEQPIRAASNSKVAKRAVPTVTATLKPSAASSLYKLNGLKPKDWLVDAFGPIVQ